MTFECLCSIAISKGVRQHRSTLSIRAPQSTREITASPLPLWAARWSGVEAGP